MGFENVIKALGVCIEARVPVLLEGGVGDAKTAIVSSLMSRLCDAWHVSIVALHEPPEYGGYPVPQSEERDPEGRIRKQAVVRLLPLEWANRLSSAKRPGLFLDEFSNGAPATRSATMRGVTDGVWGEARIQDLSTVVAMNPPEIAESGYELSAPLATRFCHLAWDMPVSYWLEQMLAGFPEPSLGPKLSPGWEENHMPWARTMVGAFAHARPSAMKAMPNAVSERSKPFPTFRSWTMAMRLLAAGHALGYGVGEYGGLAAHEVVLTLLGGCVGPGAALEFLTFAGELDLPDPEAVLANPSSLKLPDRGDRAYAVLTSVVSVVLAKPSAPRWYAAWEVLEKAVEARRLDVAGGSARLLARNRPKDAMRPPPAMKAFEPMLKAMGLI